jgi:hypothetical protein
MSLSDEQRDELLVIKEQLRQTVDDMARHAEGIGIALNAPDPKKCRELCAKFDAAMDSHQQAVRRLQEICAALTPPNWP